MRSFVFFLLLFSFAPLCSFAADAQRGEKVFRRCAICHFADRNANKIGPSLLNVIGRQAGSLDNYHYSPAMTEAGKNGLVWNKENITQYLHNPREMIKGTRMAAVGLQNETDIDDLIAYLASVSHK